MNVRAELLAFGIGISFIFGIAGQQSTPDTAFANAFSNGQNVCEGPQTTPTGVLVKELNLQNGVPFDGVIATYTLCQGCTVDRFAAPIVWGDGAVDQARVAGNGILAAAHTYVKAADSAVDFPILISISGLCINSQRQYGDGSLNNRGVAHVFPPLKPLQVLLLKPLIHGNVVNGAGALQLSQPAPPSGARLHLASSSVKVLFSSIAGASVQETDLVVRPGKVAEDFALDLRSANPGTQFIITATCVGIPLCPQDSKQIAGKVQ